MAGTHVRVDDGYIEFDDGGTIAMLKRLQDLGADMEAPFADVGEYLLLVTEERFNSESGPAGVPWVDVTPATRARKKHPKILTERGDLRHSFTYQAGADELLFGTNTPYAAIHQFGGADVGKNIPARPFLGFDSTDEFEITAIFLQHIDERVKG